ncbi:MAG: 2,4-dihydroxyhept-2-ene-1,7-dioic acid aldolase [Candidatus Heimdallarchaeota archaeon]|nr:2,4-dihydroxyhept-2-ene-1,7-dioic acid aldolase [Candidatus Heimdallarchaeota archaeon]
MREFKVIEKLSEGEIVINAWLSIPSSQTAELIANLGYDMVTLDLQHGMIDSSTALQMLQGISTSKAFPMVRLPWNDPGFTMKILDAGAMGVICPMISTAEDTKKFIDAVRYPPLGKRSWGPVRASVYAGDDYFDKANETVLALALIETKEGVDNMDAILDTPGLDGVYIGTVDLSISLGCDSLGDINDPMLREAMDTIMEAVKERGMIAGVHTKSVEQSILLKDRGLTILTPITDIRILSNAARVALEGIQSVLKLSEN